MSGGSERRPWLDHLSWRKTPSWPWLSTFLVVPVVFLLVSPIWADFSGVSSVGFSYCYAAAENDLGATCSDSEFTLGGSCAASCGVPAAGVEISGQPPWEILGESWSNHGDVVYAAQLQFQADRSEAEVVTLSGSCAPDYPWAEIALFRFDGDPSVFDGSAATSVTEFVDLGWIDAADVLFVDACSDSSQIAFDVNVGTIPDEELVIFAFIPTSPGLVFVPPVPALSQSATVGLAVLLLGIGAIALRRRF